MPLLQVEEVRKNYGGLPAVDGVSLEVDDGEILAIVGPNGAGKSTLLTLIAGLAAPSSGTITFAGTRISGLAPHRVRHQGVAMVMQTPRVFGSMTTIENAIVGAMFGTSNGPLRAADARAHAEEALEVVGLGKRRDDHVDHLNLHEQRFLELARAVAGKPRLLLLDEVMAGLNDTELAASISIIRKLRDQLGLTVIWVEHVMKAVLDLAERAVVLNFGQTLATGSPHEVMRDAAVIEAYLGEAFVA